MFREYYDALLTNVPYHHEAMTRWTGVTRNSVVDAWFYRYAYWRDAINGLILADREVVVQRNRARYAITPFAPQLQLLDHPPDTPYWLPRNDQKHYDNLKFVKANHPEYGPLLQWLVRKAEARGLDESELWKLILHWSLRPPPQKEEFERRERAVGQSDVSPALARYFQEAIIWYISGDPDNPWIAHVGSSRCVLHLNDFPDEYLFTLVVDGQPVGDFNDFPKTYKRSRRSGVPR